MGGGEQWQCRGWSRATGAAADAGSEAATPHSCKGKARLVAEAGELLAAAVCVSTSRLDCHCSSVIEAWQRSINHYAVALIDIVRGKKLHRSSFENMS